MLKTIEQLTRQPIQIETIPTVADLKARRLELTRAALHESLLEDDLEPFRVVLDTLSDEFDPLSVALAAIKLAHEATTVGGDEDAEADIPQMTLARPNPKAKAGTGGRARRDGAGETPRRSGAGETVRIYIGVGRGAQVRPQDLVGAITGETQLQGREIGTIEIADRFSLVEVPVSRADEVIQGLRNTKLKGRKATVRREKFERR
jgi:ATP-dependent RNA helicase DeaD